MNAQFNFNVFFATSLVVLSACAAGTKHAHAAANAAPGSNEKQEHWTGNGVLFGPDGKKRAEYTLDLRRMPQGDGVVEQVVTVHIPNQPARIIKQSLKEGDQGFEIVSEAGNGGGFDLGKGILTVYTTNAEGIEHASSIFVKGDEMAILRYELKDGQVQAFYREILGRTR